MSPLVAARMLRNLDTDVRPFAPAETCRLGVQSTMRAAALLPTLAPNPLLWERAGGRVGPMTPAQLSQYAASPIRYGQPPGIVAYSRG